MQPNVLEFHATKEERGGFPSDMQDGGKSQPYKEKPFWKMPISGILMKKSHRTKAIHASFAEPLFKKADIKEENRGFIWTDDVEVESCYSPIEKIHITDGQYPKKTEFSLTDNVYVESCYSPNGKMHTTKKQYPQKKGWSFLKHKCSLPCIPLLVAIAQILGLFTVLGAIQSNGSTMKTNVFPAVKDLTQNYQEPKDKRWHENKIQDISLCSKRLLIEKENICWEPQLDCDIIACVNAHKNTWCCILTTKGTKVRLLIKRENVCWEPQLVCDINACVNAHKNTWCCILTKKGTKVNVFPGVKDLTQKYQEPKDKRWHEKKIEDISLCSKPLDHVIMKWNDKNDATMKTISVLREDGTK